MSFASSLKRLRKALPFILAAAPGIIDAVQQVRQALKKPKEPGAAAGSVVTNGPPAAPQTIER